jgi:hypothetical protein
MAWCARPMARAPATRTTTSGCSRRSAGFSGARAILVAPADICAFSGRRKAGPCRDAESRRARRRRSGKNAPAILVFWRTAPPCGCRAKYGRPAPQSIRCAPRKLTIIGWISRHRRAPGACCAARPWRQRPGADVGRTRDSGGFSPRARAAARRVAVNDQPQVPQPVRPGRSFSALPAWPVAQWLERDAHNGYVAGSNPAGPTNQPK